MFYSLLNVCVIIAVILFYHFCFAKKTAIDYADLLPIILLCVIQAFLVIVLYAFEYTSFPKQTLTRCYVFSVYYCLIALFKFACVYYSKKKRTYINYLVVAVSLIIAYYCFFYLNVSFSGVYNASHEILENNPFLVFNLGHYAFTPYVLILPVSSLLILAIRSFIVKDNVLRFKLIVISFVYISIFVLLIVLVLEGSSKNSFNYMYSLATLYIVLVLYRILLINHVPSIKKAFKVARTFFWEYMLFALFITIAFIFFFHALAVNLALYSLLGSITIFLLFYAQALVRKKNKATFIRDTAEVTLGNFFSNIDYSSGKEVLFTSFCSMLSTVFEASEVDFFVVEGDELHITQSTRKSDFQKLSLNSKVFSTICHSEIPVISRDLYHSEKELVGVRDELEGLFEYCNSQVMIIMHGERSIIGLVSLGEKERSVRYSTHDLDLMKYFYPNFFVFGYYLQTSIKESLMTVISREIEFSGQVTESIYKNIDRIQHQSIDTGYISKSLRNLGGDFIDIIRLTDERHMFVVGDVSGRGLNASMCMIILKSFIRTFLRESNDFLSLVNKLNNFIKHNLPRGTFFAGTFMIYDNVDKMLYYINCGVPAIFLYSKAYNNVIEIQGEGKVLGFVEDVNTLLAIKKIQLQEGDVVLTCTDGITDSLSLRGEEYGKRRIENVLFENKLFPAQNICTFAYDDLQSFTAKGVSDDVSILAIKIIN